MSRGELIRLATLHALLAGALVNNNDNLQVALPPSQTIPQKEGTQKESRTHIQSPASDSTKAWIEESMEHYPMMT